MHGEGGVKVSAEQGEGGAREATTGTREPERHRERAQRNLQPGGHEDRQGDEEQSGPLGVQEADFLPFTRR
jgi:hypothetical protein